MNLITAFLSFLLYWARTFSNARNTDFTKLQESYDIKADRRGLPAKIMDEKDWILDKLDEIAVTVLSTLTLMSMMPSILKGLILQLDWIQGLGAEATSQFLAFLFGICANWCIDKLLGGTKKVAGDVLK